ncbi:phosphoribosyltransferase family protein [Longispora sp. NPDC051575]|uniref:ComF family protein n=1 Tax=Longispora sp. NPDC051575 TaxID=3154943 RepID=UPI00342D4413
MLRDLIDLVLPADCPCGGQGPFCPACRAVLAGPPLPTAPTPAPPGLPPCLASGPYDGPLRDVLLAYKERGRRDLAAPLGDQLAVGVSRLLANGPAVLVPVPTTAAAVRARRGDHMERLARRAVDTLRRGGRRATLLRALVALPKPDSAGLSAAERALAAQGAFRVRAGCSGPLRAGLAVVLVDDILTTGSTLAATANQLRSVDIPVRGAVVIAATRRRGSLDNRVSQAETPTLVGS